VKNEFMKALMNKSKDGSSVSYEEFLDYYLDVSATLPK